jgi:hypothetical protein
MGRLATNRIPIRSKGAGRRKLRNFKFAKDINH